MPKSTQPTIAPLGNRILVKTPHTSKEEKGERIEGGIVIPESTSVETQQALKGLHVVVEVLAVGPECGKAVKKGDRVLVRKQALFVIAPEIIGSEQTLIEERDAFAVVK